MNSKRQKHKIFFKFLTSFFWFSVGAALGLFLFVSFVFIIFEKRHKNTVYPGVIINGVSMGGKTTEEVRSIFAQRNEMFANTKFIFTNDDSTETVITARELDFGYNENLLATQAYSIGRSNDILSNISIIFQAYLYGINLPPSYHYSEPVLEQKLATVLEKYKIEPIDALFTFQNGRVLAFRPSSDGQEVDLKSLKNSISSKILAVVSVPKEQTITIGIPITTVKPKITTDKANNLGIKELIAEGKSLFQGSIPNRIHNVTLATSKINGVLIAPNEVFSFNKALGDVSLFTGYKQAYVISEGRTILGDGGGVCQVSTTFFRAILNAGLPVIERHPHSYRVGYYEQDSLPGLDATVYVPTVDLKFKNDTGNYILVQGTIDPYNQSLTFMFYGTSDGRKVTIGKPVISNQTPAPAPLYQDDPTLPKGVTKQVDFAAAGAQAFFTREVSKDGKVIISEKFTSNYRPWQAVYLRGTQ